MMENSDFDHHLCCKPLDGVVGCSRHGLWIIIFHVLPKHLVVFNGGEPEAVGVGVVVAGSSAVTLDERHLAETFQTRARRNQGLGGALCSSSRLLERMKIKFHGK